MSYQIISDGACDLLSDYTTAHNIKIVPFYVTFDGENYTKEGEGIDHDTFYRKMIEEHAVPKSSLPSVQDYMDAFMPYVEQETPIICICITSKFSGSYNSACNARDLILETHPKAAVTVIDSTLNTASEGLFVNEAVKLRDAGISYEDSVAELERIKKTGRIYFTVGSLEYLIKNGRIGKLAVLAGDKLGIRPTIIMKDGDISLGGISRSRKKSKLSVLSALRSYLNEPGIKRITILSFPADMIMKKQRNLKKKPGNIWASNLIKPYPAESVPPLDVIPVHMLWDLESSRKTNYLINLSFIYK